MNVVDYSMEVERIKAEAVTAKETRELINNKKEIERNKALQLLTNKYGSENVKMMQSGNVKIGWTREMCLLGWGSIYVRVISKKQDASGIYEIWRHALYGRELYFKNEKLYKILN